MLLAFRIHIPNIRICKYWSLHIHETSLKFWSCSISLHISTLNSLTQPINNIPPYFPFHQEIFRFDSVETRFSLLDRALIYYFDIYIFLLLARPGARQLHTHMPVWACYTHTRQIICGFTHTHAVCDTCVENGAFGAAMIGRRHGNHRGLLANHSISGAANTHRRASAINTSCHACCSCVRVRCAPLRPSYVRGCAHLRASLLGDGTADISTRYVNYVYPCVCWAFWWITMDMACVLRRCSDCFEMCGCELGNKGTCRFICVFWWSCFAIYKK